MSLGSSNEGEWRLAFYNLAHRLHPVRVWSASLMLSKPLELAGARRKVYELEIPGKITGWNRLSF